MFVVQAVEIIHGQDGIRAAEPGRQSQATVICRRSSFLAVGGKILWLAEQSVGWRHAAS